jgi:glycosyltransferase involved in cell wall biosynthesis
VKIAFISYEYPPDTAYGGIATYTHQAAKMLHQRGHHIEVFAGSCHRSGTESEDGVLVHRVIEKNHCNFYEPISQMFAKRHAAVQFDVLEGPELVAEARGAVRRVPDIPLVVKLHSPSVLLWQSNLCLSSVPPLLERIFLRIEAKLRGFRPFWGDDLERNAMPSESLQQKDSLERMHALEADEIVAPSQAIRNRAIGEWGLEAAKVHCLPNPYIPSQDLLAIPIETCTNAVTFLGRLEVRKGVLDLARAIPRILRCYPQTQFRFVGATDMSAVGDTRHYLENFLLRRYRKSVEFTGAIPLDQVPDVLARTDICVFPSIWENFPNVCLEAMAAGRGIVGSHSGGMADMLDAGRVGRLVSPRSPESIAQVVIELLENPRLRMRLGQAARDRLLAEYNAERIGALQEASYVRAIERRRNLGAR